MGSWKLIRLGDIMTESKIGSPSPSIEMRIRVLLNTKGVIKRPNKNEKKSVTKYFTRKKGQFIYGKQNIHKGAFGVIPDELDGFESTSDLPAFDVDENCLPIWIDYYFKQDLFYFNLVKIARGVATKRVQPKELLNIKIPLPSIEEQQNTIKHFKSIETEDAELKRELTHQQTLLKKLHQQLLQEAIQGKLTADWRKQNPNTEPASELLKRIQTEKAQLIKDKKIKNQKPLPPINEEEKPFELPDGWVWCRLGEIINLITDGTHHTPTYTKNGIPFLSVKDIAHRKIDFSNTRYISSQEHSKLIKRCNPEYGDLLLTKVGTTGIAKVVDTKEVFSIFVSVALLKFTKDYIYNYFLENLLNAPHVKKQSAQGTKGMGNKNLVIKTISNFAIPLPPLAEQQAIVTKVEKLLTLCDQLEARVSQNQRHAAALMQAVLREAFTQRNSPSLQAAANA